MAAEHEGKERGRRGDLPAALPRPGADARPRDLRSTTSTPTSERPPPARPHSHDRKEADLMLRVAVPNKGSLSEPAAGRCCMRPATGSAATPRSCGSSTRTTTSSSSTCAPATSRSTSAPASLDIGITGRDLLRRLRRHGRGDPRRSASAAPPSASPPSPARRTAVEDLDGHDGSPPRTRASSPSTSPTTASTPPSSTSTARSRPPIELGVAEVIADVVETGTTLRNAGPGGLRRADPEVRGGRHPPHRRRRRGRRQGPAVPAPPPGRPGRPDAT